MTTEANPQPAPAPATAAEGPVPASGAGTAATGTGTQVPTGGVGLPPAAAGPRGPGSTGVGPLAPWSLVPRAWLEPAGRHPGPWRPEEGLSPQPLTPYSAALWLEVLPELTARISRDLSLPSAGVDLTLDEHGRLLSRPRPAGRWPGALAWRAARHGWNAARQARDLVRWWDEQGARALLADAGELRLRVIPLERSGHPGGDLKEWRRVLERCREIWIAHLDRLLRLEALATLSLWQLDALLEAFRLPGNPRAADLVPVPAVVAEIPQRLWHMAARGRESAAVAAVFAAPPYHPRLSRLAAGQTVTQPGSGAGAAGGPQTGAGDATTPEAGAVATFFELWHQFLERYGYVAWPAAELAAPTWAEDPEPALAWLAVFFHDRRLSPVAAEINAHRRQQELSAAIARRLARRPLDRGRIEETQRLAEATTRVAAEMGYHVLVLRSWWRRAVLGAGRALAARGLLDEPAAAWRRTPAELEALLAAAGGTASGDGATAAGPAAGDRAPAATGTAGGPAPTPGSRGSSPPAGRQGQPDGASGGSSVQAAAPGERAGTFGSPSAAAAGEAAAGQEAADPDADRLEQARQRAHRFFRYAGMGYFVLLAVIPVILARQGVLWIGLREMARLLLETVLVLAPLAAVAGAVYLLARGRRTPRRGAPERRHGPRAAGGS
ncbi:hypothetical protein Tmar_1409 [Thermaerobacter marianensis DSM 12885]|uniref:Uncharacterized protein n=1 Tax=Thermaerobacter marianensis (strain ATCC 700841 / DSM 12885 / JCM 10246 / 7p75a) TaxID=644966 RepID=E6SMN0_THEM7|nr:hypothetical protein [Thermaerobacter marianensis]ADU51522.1 hypothetical protein Tmar_1409 [Thermaerobacter marianensis DSM 12885]